MRQPVAPTSFALFLVLLATTWVASTAHAETMSTPDLHLVSTGSTYVSLAWSPSVGTAEVKTYFVIRDGRFLDNTQGTKFVDNNVSPSTGYTYTVVATDQAQDQSAPSAPVTVTTPAVRPGNPIGPHPRLWLDTARLARMRRGVAENSLEWQALRRDVEDYYQAVPAGSEWAAIAHYALTYQVLKDMTDPATGLSCLDHVGSSFGVTRTANEFGAYGASLLNKVVAAAEPACQANFGKPCSDELPAWTLDFRGLNTEAVTFDWIYPFLSAQDKAAFVTEMHHCAVYNANRQRTEPGLVDPANNLFSGVTSVMLLMGYATFGDNPTDDLANQTNFELTRAWNNYQAYIKPFWSTLGRGGATPDGNEYGWANPWDYSQWVLAARTAEGRDLLAAGELPDLVDDWATWSIHATAPALGGSRGAYDWGDEEHPGYFSDGAHEAALWIADLASDPVRSYARYWVDHAIGFDFFSAVSYDWERFLLHDPHWAATDYRTIPISTEYQSGVGIHSWRSDWTPDATWVTFGPVWTSTNHAHSSQGNFTIYRKGQWLAQAFPGYSQCYPDAAVHNVMLFKGSSDGIWKGPISLMGYSPGRIVDYETAAGYDYAAADLSGPYHSYTVGTAAIGDWLNARTVGREFVYLKPDVTVVLDRATFRDGDTNIRFTATTPGTVAVTGSTLTETNGGQSLNITPVFPAQVELTALDFSTVANWYYDGGAAGCWGDPQYRYVDHWYQQAQVTTRNAGPSQVMLNVMQAADQGTTPTPVARIQGGDLLAALIQDPAENHLVSFSGDPLGTIGSGGTLAWTANAPATTVLLVDLDPGRTWRLQIDGGTTRPFSPSAHGTVSLSVPRAGAHTLDVHAFGPIPSLRADPISGPPPLTVAFDASGSTDADGTITSFAWDFGDGGSDSGPNVTHVYTTAQVFVAKVTVTDDHGLVGTRSVSISVGTPDSGGTTAGSTTGGATAGSTTAGTTTGATTGGGHPNGDHGGASRCGSGLGLAALGFALFACAIETRRARRRAGRPLRDD